MTSLASPENTTAKEHNENQATSAGCCRNEPSREFFCCSLPRCTMLWVSTSTETAGCFAGKSHSHALTVCVLQKGLIAKTAFLVGFTVHGRIVALSPVCTVSTTQGRTDLRALSSNSKLHPLGNRNIVPLETGLKIIAIPVHERDI